MKNIWYKSEREYKKMGELISLLEKIRTTGPGHIGKSWKICWWIDKWKRRIKT